jgi:hypothetical protein
MSDIWIFCQLGPHTRASGTRLLPGSTGPEGFCTDYRPALQKTQDALADSLDELLDVLLAGGRRRAAQSPWQPKMADWYQAAWASSQARPQKMMPRPFDE